MLVIENTNPDSNNQNIHPDLKKYSLKQASEIITNKKAEHTEDNLIELASESNLGISLHHPKWVYVRTDQKGLELESALNPMTGEYFVLPVDKSHLFNNAEDYDEGTSYPFIPSEIIKQLLIAKSSDSPPIAPTLKTSGMDAVTLEGDKIKITPVALMHIGFLSDAQLEGLGMIYSSNADATKVILKAGNLKRNSQEKLEWMQENNNIIIPIQRSLPYQPYPDSDINKHIWIEEHREYIELKEDMLCITKPTLQTYIDSLASSPNELQQVPELVGKLSNKEKPKAREVIEGLKDMNEKYCEIDDTRLIAEMKDLIVSYYGEKPTQKEIVDDLALKGVSVSRQVMAKYLAWAFDV